VTRENECDPEPHQHAGICQRAGYAFGFHDGFAAEREPLLTDDERAAIRMAGELWGVLCALVDDGPTRSADLGELILHVHAIQHAVMSQAAARAYPDELRRLGSTLDSSGGQQ
jgi:hypothetical protein